MTYDPMQAYSALGGYSGATNPFQSPYSGLQSSLFNAPGFFHPAGQWGPQAAGQIGQQGYPGISAYGGPQQNPLVLAAQQQIAVQQLIQQLAQQIALQQQLAQQIAAQQTNPMWMNPALANPALTNPILNPLLNPQAGAYSHHHGHQGQFGQQGFPLAPQSWVGQPNPSAIFSQFNPRAAYGQGLAGF